MGERRRIGLVYMWDEKWLGGKYYLQNLLIALNTLEDNIKPIVNLYCLDDNIYKEFYQETKYPYLVNNTVKVSLWKKIYHKLYAFVFGITDFNAGLFRIDPKDEIVFPLCIAPNTKKMIYWIPDFQEKHLPQYFSKKEIKTRDDIVRNVCKRRIPIIFSSYDCQNDFYYYYPEFANHPTYVVHFAVNQLDYSKVSYNVLKKKYGICKPYLMCPNQFWKHKNHLFLFRSFKMALENGIDLQLVCTGRMEDYRNPDYIREVKTFLSDNKLYNNVLLLGIIEKKEMLCLMKNSYAVIQPSLFEGWNTTVEDCKAMGKYVFLSDLKVHREQISTNVCFFNPMDEMDLVDKLMNVSPDEKSIDYRPYQKEFGSNFISIIENIISHD